MKDNSDMLQGGKLKPEYYDSWARYYGKFIHAYEKEGIPIWGLTVQNEPLANQTWESCIYTAEEERDFVKNYLGPALQKAGLKGKKIIIWDHNRVSCIRAPRWFWMIPAAAKYVWGVGFHWYVGDNFENVKRVAEAYPSTHLLFTEGCNGPFDFSKINDWQWGETYGKSMVNDFNNGAEGWTDWNVLLDEKGGPNHVQNFCFAPIHADTKTGRVVLHEFLLLHRPFFQIHPSGRKTDHQLLHDRQSADHRLFESGRKNRRGGSQPFRSNNDLQPFAGWKSRKNQQPGPFHHDHGDLIPSCVQNTTNQRTHPLTHPSAFAALPPSFHYGATSRRDKPGTLSPAVSGGEGQGEGARCQSV